MTWPTTIRISSPRNAFRWFPTHNINVALQKYWTVPVAGREFTVQAIFEVFNVLKSYFWDLPVQLLDVRSVRPISADERPEAGASLPPDHVLRFTHTHDAQSPAPVRRGRAFL